MNRSKQRILVIHTGGTFGMLPEGPGFAPHLPELVPELARLAEVTVRSPFLLDSSQMTPEHWGRLAELVASNLETYDGFVITHGTDTLAYTGAALSFMLENLPRPVVLTGAQRPLTALRNDAHANLLDAVEAAGQGVPEVLVAFGGRIFRANRVRKRSLTALAAFESPNAAALGEVGTASLQIDRNRVRSPGGTFRLRTELDPRVVHLKVVPGMTGSTLRGLDTPEVRGIVLEAFGAGNLPLGPESPVETIRTLTARGVPVVIVSGCEHGAVDLDRYEAGRAVRDAGAIGGGDLTGEAALVKLMVALGRARDRAEVRAIMTTDLAGEITPPGRGAD